MGVGRAEQVTPCRFQEIARHLDVVVTEVKQEHPEAEQRLALRVHAKLDQLTDETNHFDLREKEKEKQQSRIKNNSRENVFKP